MPLAIATTHTHSRTRSRSISLSLRLTALSPTSSSDKSLDFLPTEVILDIIELATYAPALKSAQASPPTTKRTLPAFFYNDSDGEGTSDDEDGEGTRSGNVASKSVRDTKTLLAISRTSRLLAELAFSVLYRTVKLSEPLTAELFLRTVHGPSLHIAGRDATRLILDADVDAELNFRTPKAFTGAAGHWRFQVANGAPNAAAQRKTENDRARMLAAAGRVLGLTPLGTLTAVRPTKLSLSSSPPSVFSSLRTLVVHSSLLSSFVSVPATPDRSLLPNPTEIVLDTYLPATSVSPLPYSYQAGNQRLGTTTTGASAPGGGEREPALSRLAAHTTHLSVLSAPTVWRLPSETLSAFGDLPNLTHLAVVRRANANEANDEEFVKDLENVLVERGANALECLVVGILPDSGWRSRINGKDGSKGEGETHKEFELESYLVGSHIWSRLAALAHSSSTSSHMTPACSTAHLCIVPMRGDAWSRASSSASGLRGNKRVWWGSGLRNAPGEDFWSWAMAYEMGRKTRAMERELHERMLVLQTGAR